MNGIVHVRIDDRLLHGQVCAVWSSLLKVSRIMVANDKVAEDEMQKSVLRMAAPASIKTSLISLKKAYNNISQNKYSNQRVLLILKSPQDAISLIDMGLDIKHINVGNMAYRPNTIQYKHSISLNTEEYDAFMELEKRGVTLTAQMLPEEPESSLMSYLKK